MRTWNRTLKHFGEVHPGTVEYTFEYYGDKEYKKHLTSCSCISSDWKDNQIKISFEAKPPTVQAKEAGIYHREVSKTVTIFWKDGTKDTLTLKALVLDHEIEID